MEFRFMYSGPNELSETDNKQRRANVRSHASRAGKRKNNSDKANQDNNTIQTYKKATPIKVDLPKQQAKFRVVLKDRIRPQEKGLGTNDRFVKAVTWPTTSSTQVGSHLYHRPPYWIPAPSRLISIEINCPRYLHLWTNELFPDTEIYHKCFNVHNVLSLDHIRPYLEDDVFVNTIAATTYAIAQVRKSPTEPYSKDVLSHRGEALRTLHEKLNQPEICDTILLAILYLIMLEDLLGHRKVSIMHKEMLRRLMQQRGGFTSLSMHLQSAILQQDEWWIEGGADPVITRLKPLETLDFPTLPLPSELLSSIKLLPSGFQRLAMQGQICSSNLEILFRVTDLHLQMQGQPPPSERNNLDQNPHRTFFEACPVLHMQESNDTIFQRLLCSTLLIYCTIELGTNKSYLMALKAKAEMSTRLPNLQMFDAQLELCIFWMFEMLVRSCINDYGNLEGYGPAVQEAQRWRFHSLYESGKVEEVLGDFSWSTSVTTGTSEVETR